MKEKYSHRHADPIDWANKTELGSVLCPFDVSYFQLMTLCLELNISITPEKTTTRDWLLRRVVSFIKVLDEVNSFADNRVVSFVYKEDGIPSNNTSMEALASD